VTARPSIQGTREAQRRLNPLDAEMQESLATLSEELPELSNG